MAMDQHVRQAVETVMTHVRRDLDAHLRTLMSDLLRFAQETAERSYRARVETLRTIRRIDEAATLSGILDALAKGAAAETSRVAILLVDGDRLRVWGHFGFAEDLGPVELSIGQSGVLASAVTLRQTSFVPSLLDQPQMAVPAFMRVPAGHTGLVIPIVVAADVVAVLYADVDRLAAHEDAPVWIEDLELLVRHASLRLENVTSERTVEVLTRPV
jgi:hypothetical protein